MFAVCALVASGLVFNSGCKSLPSWLGGAGGEDTIDSEITDNVPPGEYTRPGEALGAKEGEWTPIPGVKLPTVYFAYDQSTIGTSEHTKLQYAADYLKNNTDNNLIIEGNCDERGSLEYNRALGERRAISIRDALVNLGVTDNRMKTISYGEERPAVQGHDEAAWAKNRRGDLVPAK